MNPRLAPSLSCVLLAGALLGGCAAQARTAQPPTVGSAHPAAAQRTARWSVPGNVTRMLLDWQRGRGPGGAEPPAVLLATVTDPGQLHRITALLNALPARRPGVYNCPADFGGALVLDFYVGADPKPVATAVDERTGCRTVQLTVRGVPGSAVLVDGGFQDELLALLHVPAPSR